MTRRPHPLAGMIAGAARMVSGVTTQWMEPLLDMSQRVYFANHTSHLDFVVLWSSLPQPMRAVTRPVAAQDYWDHGLRRRLAVNVFRAILIARNPNTSSLDSIAASRATIDHIVKEMGDRYSLIIFPEGTRGTGEQVAPFKSGLYYLCRLKPGLTLVPAYINNLNRILPKGEFLPVPFISRIIFGASMRLEQNEGKAEFLGRMRDAVCRLKSS